MLTKQAKNMNCLCVQYTRYSYYYCFFKHNDDEYYDLKYEEYKQQVFSYWKKIVLFQNGKFSNDHSREKYEGFLDHNLNREKNNSEYNLIEAHKHSHL